MKIQLTKIHYLGLIFALSASAHFLLPEKYQIKQLVQTLSSQNEEESRDSKAKSLAKIASSDQKSKITITSSDVLPESGIRPSKTPNKKQIKTDKKKKSKEEINSESKASFAQKRNFGVGSPGPLISIHQENIPTRNGQLEDLRTGNYPNSSKGTVSDTAGGDSASESNEAASVGTSAGGTTQRVIYGKVPMLGGSSASLWQKIPQFLFKKAWASTCEANVSLYQLSADGTLASAALMTSPVDNEGKFLFQNLHTIDLPIELNFEYLLLLEANGCVLEERLIRYLTSTSTPQDFSYPHNLIAATRLTSSYINRATWDLTKIENLANALAGETSTNLTFHQKLKDNTTNEDLYNEIFLSPYTNLTQVPPLPHFTSVYTEFNEKQSYELRAKASHWDDSYPLLYEWIWDGETVSINREYDHAPSANDQGDRVLLLRIGQNDGANKVDTTKEYLEYTYNTFVTDTHPVQAPSFELVTDFEGFINSTTVNLDVTTGLAMSLCETFDDFVIKEVSTTPGLAEFNRNCTTENTQTENYTFTDLSEGVKNLYLWTKDSSDNISSPQSISFTLLLSGPLAPLATLSTPNISGALDARFQLSSCPAGVSIAYNLTGVAPLSTALDWQACSTNAAHYLQTIPALEQQHTISVWARDPSGNISNVTELDLIYDVTNPNLNVATSFAGSYRGADSVTINLTSSDANGLSSLLFQYAADGVNFSTLETLSSATTSYAWTLPIDNTVNARIRVVSSDNSAPANTSTHTSAIFTIDSTPPTAPIVSLASPAINSEPDYAVTIASCEVGASAFLSTNATSPDRDDIGWQACTTGAGDITAVLPGGSNDGLKNIYVFLKDSVGNVSDSTSLNFIFDTTTPNLAFSALSSVNLRGLDNIDLNYSTSDSNGISNLRLEYAVDGANYVFVKDLDENQTQTNWSIPADDTTVARLRIVSTDNATPANSIIVQSSVFEIDSSAPAVPDVLLASPAISSSRMIEITANHCNDTTQLFVSLAATTPSREAMEWQSCNLTAGGIGFELPVATVDGAKDLYIFAKDAVGNISSWSTLQMIYDTTLPNLTFSTALSGSYRGGQDLVFNFVASDTNNLSRLELFYAQDGVNFSSLQNLTVTDTNYTWTLPAHNTAAAKIRLVATDNATTANIASYESGAFTIDSTAPAAPSIALISPAITSSRDIVFSALNCNDTTSIMVLTVDVAPARDDAGYQNCLSPTDYLTTQLPVAATDGTKTFYLFSKDAVGNVSTTSTQISVIYDTTPPFLNLATTLSGAYRGGSSLDLTISTNDSNGVSFYELQYAADGVNFNPITSLSPAATTYSFVFPSDNTTTAKIRLVSRDGATTPNQTIVISGTFSIDSTAPNAPVVALSSPAITSLRDFTLTSANCTDTTHLLVKYSTIPPEITDPLWQACSTTASAITAQLAVGSSDGTKVATIFAKDAVGNISTYSQVSFIYDTTIPNLTFSTTITPKYRGADTLNMSFTSTDINGLSSLQLFYTTNDADYTLIENLAVGATGKVWTIPAINSSNVRLRLISTDNATPANVNTYTSSLFEIDSTPPVAPVLSIVTPNPTGVTNLTFTHVACGDRTHLFISESATTPDRNAAGWQSCQATPGAISYTLIGPTMEINHTLYYFAKDDVGNISTSSTGNIIYDVTSPTLSSTTTLNSTYRGGETLSLNYASADTNNLSELFLLYSVDGTTFPAGTRVDLNPALSSQNWNFPTDNTTTAKVRLVSRDTSTPKNERILDLGPFSIDSTPPVPPTIAFHAPDNTPAITSLTDVQLTTPSCTDVNALFISQSTTKPAFNHADWQSCTTTLGGLNYTLLGPVMEVSHEMYIYARDAVGNVSNYSSLSVIYDNTNPALNISTALNTHYKGGADHVFNFASSDANGVKNLTFEYAQDGVNFTTLATLAGTATSYTWAAPSVNVSTARIRMRSTDNAQPVHITTWTSPSFTIDSIAPALTITSPAANSFHRSSVTVTGLCEIGTPLHFAGAILEDFSIACTTGSYSQPLSFTAGDGNKLITISQTDLAGNITSIPRNFIRDEVPPILARTTGDNPAFNNTNNYTWGGTCEGNYTISVTGDQTSSFACNNGSWSFTNTNKVIDSTYNFTLNQTDAAGNVSSPLTLTWTRDATSPLFNASTPLAISSGQTQAITTNGNNVIVSGNCEGANPIAITGTVSDFMSCSASSWSWTAPTVATDGLRTYQFTQTDSAGNTSVLTLQWTRDTTGPALILATASTTKTNQSSQTFNGECEVGLDINISGAQTATAACTTGTWSWTTAVQATDAARNYQFAQTNGFGTTTSVSAQWIRGTAIPTISLTNTSTASPSKVSFAKVNMNAQSNNTGVFVSHFCFKSNDDIVPLESDVCWSAVNSPSVGLPLATTLNLVEFSYLLGWTPTAYVVKAWVKDEAGNISVNSNGSGIDRFNITYAPGIPPQVSDVIAANSDITQNPPTRAESVVPPGSDVYIRWKLINPEGPLPPGAVSLYYTENELDFTQITGAEALNNANYGCPNVVLTADEGCFKWTAGSPLSTPYKIRVQAINYSELSSQSISTILNSTTIKILAGNTESGLGGSAQTAMFLTRKEGSEADPHSLIVTNDGRFYFIDYARGIFTINPETGNQEVFIRTTGTSTGDGGAAVSATLRYPIKMTLDFQNRLLILDVNRIRRVDLNQSTPTIETIIGGGTNTNDTVANPLDVSFYTHSTNSWTSRSMIFFTTPNGDIYFQSDYGIKNYNQSSWRFRIYQAATGQVISKYLTGSGNVVDTTQDLSACRMQNLGLRFNASSVITGATAYTNYGLGYPGCDTRNDTYIRTYYDPITFVSTAGELTTANHIAGYRYFHVTAMNGETYVYIDRNYLNIVNYQNSPQTTRVLGSGVRGQCIDGTAPGSCNMDLQDVFITADNKIYFLDGGLIRTIDENGLVKTLFGQRPSYGNGVNALNARFEQINYIAEKTDGKIIVADSTSYLIKEFTVEGNINTIAGNGTASTQNLTDIATNQPLSDSTWLIADKATGDLYARRSWAGEIVILNRSTGKWEPVIGNGATNYLSADGLFGSALRSVDSQDLALPIGFDGQKLLTTRMRYNTPEIRYDNFALKLYDRNDNYKQSHLAGGIDDTTYDNTCASGMPASTCKVPYWDRFYAEGHWDAANNRWLLYNRVINSVFSYTPGGNFEIIGPLHAGTNNGVAYAKEGSNDIIYYCQGGRLHKRNLTTNTQDPTLNWPVTNLYCRGMKINYNSSRHTIIFPFEQNGLYGVAEYYLP